MVVVRLAVLVVERFALVLLTLHRQCKMAPSTASSTAMVLVFNYVSFCRSSEIVVNEPVLFLSLLW